MSAEKTALPPVGRPGGWHRRVWRLAGPIVLSNLSVPLMGAVDTAVVGRLPDPALIGGVAIGAVIFNFLFWGFGFLRMATTGFTAQAEGADDRHELRAAFLRPLLLALVIGGLLILVQSPLRSAALWLMDGSAAVEGHAGAYFDIRIWSAPAALINYAVVGWLLGSQRAGTTLALQLLLNGTNITLSVVLVLGLGWGVAGVAAATLCAECTAAVVGLVVVRQRLRHKSLSVAWTEVLARGRLLALFRVNRDIFIRTVCLISAFALFTSRGAGLGDITLAGNAILMHLQQFMGYGLDGFAHAAEILAGSAYGARSLAAFRQAVRVSTVWAAATALAIAAVYGFAGMPLIALFTPNPEIQSVAAAYLPWMVVSPLISVWSFQLDGIFIGTTRSAAMRNAMLLSLLCFVVAAWLLVPILGNHGLWLAFVLFMAARAITLGAFYPALERSLAARQTVAG